MPADIATSEEDVTSESHSPRGVSDEQLFSRSRRMILAAAACVVVFAAVASCRSPRSGAARSEEMASGIAQKADANLPQFIAALGDTDASAGGGAHLWGLWRLDPGPRGVQLSELTEVLAAGGATPAGWTLDGDEWWLEEHGLIMEKPDIPLPAGKYRVTGGGVTADLTVEPKDGDGKQAWQLDGATLGDVTHGPCRAARYMLAAGSGASCSPDSMPSDAFPVAPGGSMPPVAGCDKQDYRVLIVVGIGS